MGTWSLNRCTFTPALRSSSAASAAWLRQRDYGQVRTRQTAQSCGDPEERPAGWRPFVSLLGGQERPNRGHDLRHVRPFLRPHRKHKVVLGRSSSLAREQAYLLHQHLVRPGGHDQHRVRDAGNCLGIFGQTQQPRLEVPRKLRLTSWPTGTLGGYLAERSNVSQL